MTEEDAVIVAEICKHADGECPVCVDKLADDLKKAFPDFNWHEMMEVAVGCE